MYSSRATPHLYDISLKSSSFSSTLLLLVYFPRQWVTRASRVQSFSCFADISVENRGQTSPPVAPFTRTRREPQTTLSSLPFERRGRKRVRAALTKTKNVSLKGGPVMTGSFATVLVRETVREANGSLLFTPSPSRTLSLCLLQIYCLWNRTTARLSFLRFFFCARCF